MLTLIKNFLLPTGTENHHRQSKIYMNRQDPRSFQNNWPSIFFLSCDIFKYIWKNIFGVQVVSLVPFVCIDENITGSSIVIFAVDATQTHVEFYLYVFVIHMQNLQSVDINIKACCFRLLYQDSLRIRARWLIS